MNIGLTLIGQMLTFAIFVWFTLKFIWPNLEQALETRRQKIADGLAAAEKGQQALAQSAIAIQEEFNKTKLRCNEIITAAQQQAIQIIAEAKNAAEQERDNIIASGRATLEHELIVAKQGLQTKVADIVVLGAEKILARTVNAADHSALLQKLVKDMAV